MADTPHIPDETETRAKWSAFAWISENANTAAMYVGCYLTGRQQSAVIVQYNAQDADAYIPLMTDYTLDGDKALCMECV